MQSINDLFGVYDDKLSALNMIARAIFVFFAAILFIRLSGIRTLGRQTSFDQLTTFILGSMLARIIIQGGNFWGSLLAVVVIVFAHRFLSWVSYKNAWLGGIIKGKPLILIDRGQRVFSNLRRGHITDEDIDEALRKTLSTANLDKIKEVYLERSGEITFVKKDKI